MQTISLEAFRPEITVVVPGLPDDMVDNYVRLACIEMAQRTGMLEREYVLDAQECVTDYLLDDCEEQIHMLHSVCLVTGCGQEQLPISARSGCDGTTCHGSSARFEPPRLLVISPAPATSVEGGIMIRAAVAPTQGACSVDIVFHHRHFESVVSGALSKLLLIPGKDFNPALAKYHLDRYNAARTRAVIDAKMGYGRDRKQMKARRFV